MTDEKKYGTPEFQASRWRRVVDLLDEQLGSEWRRSRQPPREWLGDDAIMAIRNALTAQRNLVRQGDKVRALEAELVEARDSIATLKVQLRSASERADEAARKAEVSVQFRRSGDARWEGSYTKQVVDELQRVFPRSFAGTAISEVGRVAAKALRDAATLLRDYHATQHQVYQRAEAAEHLTIGLRDDIARLKAAAVREKERKVGLYHCDPCQSFDPLIGSVPDPYPQWTAAIQSAAYVGDELEKLIGNGTPSTFSKLLRPAIAKYIRAIIAEVKERDKAHPNKQ